MMIRKTSNVLCLGILFFLSFLINISAAEKYHCLNGSKICVINVSETIDVREDKEYNWTFTDRAASDYEVSNTDALIMDNKVTCSNGSCTINNTNPIDKLQSYYSKSKINFDARKESIKDSYIYYKGMGKYNGVDVGLKVTIKSVNLPLKVKNDYVPIIVFYKDRPTLQMYGVISAYFEYSFWDQSCVSKNSFAEVCRMDEIKGYGNLKDVDYLQSVDLGENISPEQTGIVKAYIRGKDKICPQYSFGSKENSGYANNSDSECRFSPIEIKPTHTLAYQNSDSTNYQNYTDNYSYLIPNLMPIESDHQSSFDFHANNWNVKATYSTGIKIEGGFRNGIPYYTVLGCVDDYGNLNDTLCSDGYSNIFKSGNGSGLGGIFYREKTNAITSPPFPAINSSEYAWITILYRGKFNIGYYFTDYNFYANGKMSTNEYYGASYEKNIAWINNPGGNFYIDSYTKYEHLYKGVSGGEYSFSPDQLTNTSNELNFDYRTIDVNYPFMTIKGNVRTYRGNNWNAAAEEDIIKKHADSYNTTIEPLYSFVLNANNIRNIKKYNVDHPYDSNFGISCETGGKCTSTFLKTLYSDSSYAEISSGKCRDKTVSGQYCDIVNSK